MTSQMINPRDMYYFARKTGKTFEFLTTYYFEETLSEDRVPRYCTKSGVIIKKPITDPVFEERWENDQILLSAFLQGWDDTGIELIRNTLYLDYDLSEPFWKQYNQHMLKLIRELRKFSTFIPEDEI